MAAANDEEMELNSIEVTRTEGHQRGDSTLSPPSHITRTDPGTEVIDSQRKRTYNLDNMHIPKHLRDIHPYNDNKTNEESQSALGFAALFMQLSEYIDLEGEVILQPIQLVCETSSF